MTDDMVERVAEAIRDAGATWIHDDYAGLFAKNGAAPVLTMARAAIEAMRIPTKQMIDRAEANSWEDIGCDPDSAYQTMIEAALSPSPETTS